MQRPQPTLMLIRDLLEHMNDCCDQWSDATDRSQHYLAQSMQHDLNQLSGLCESLKAAEQREAQFAGAW